MEKLVIIGGNAAGLTAAARAKRIDPRLNITVLEKLPQISYSTCGIPYFLSNLVTPESLVSYSPESFEKERGIKVHTQVSVEAIVPSKRRVEGKRVDTGEKVSFPFERLLIATGVKAKVPDIPGTQLQNVFTMVNLADALRIREPLRAAQSVAIVGAGYVGLELAECFHALGKSVHVFEQEPHVLSSVDPDMAQIIEYELRRFGIGLTLKAKLLALVGTEGKDGHVNGVKATSTLGVKPADLVVLDTGVQPNIDLTAETDIRIGMAGGIAVNSSMETSVPGVYAAGNCAETWCPIRRRPVLNFIGTVAAKQGRIAGENMAARRTKFLGAIGTTVLKVFDLSVARTGLSTNDAALERMDIISTRIEAEDRASYYPGARKLWVKLIVEKIGRKLVGAQVVGYGDASKRIDVVATAITAGMRIDEFAQLDLAYSPPYSSLWDPVLIAAQALMRKMGRH
jgi:NADPH-dependent 2,4-dienoyl-CoA reductase/sulfur reductase-like enzyme